MKVFQAGSPKMKPAQIRGFKKIIWPSCVTWWVPTVRSGKHAAPSGSWMRASWIKLLVPYGCWVTQPRMHLSLLMPWQQSWWKSVMNAGCLYLLSAHWHLSLWCILFCKVESALISCPFPLQCENWGLGKYSFSDWTGLDSSCRFISLYPKDHWNKSSVIRQLIGPWLSKTANHASSFLLYKCLILLQLSIGLICCIVNLIQFAVVIYLKNSYGSVKSTCHGQSM